MWNEAARQASAAVRRARGGSRSGGIGGRYGKTSTGLHGTFEGAYKNRLVDAAAKKAVRLTTSMVGKKAIGGRG